MKLFFLTSLMLVASGCALFKSKEAPVAVACETHDWYQVGYDLGLQGTSFESMQHIPQTCNEMDQEALMTGYYAGVIKFCSPSQALFLGKRGGKNPEICPKSLESSFRTAYEKGVAVYQLSQDNEKLSVQMEAASQKLSESKLEPTEKNQIESYLTELRNKKQQNTSIMSQIESEIKTY